MLKRHLKRKPIAVKTQKWRLRHESTIGGVKSSWSSRKTFEILVSSLDVAGKNLTASTITLMDFCRFPNATTTPTSPGLPGVITNENKYKLYVFNIDLISQQNFNQNYFFPNPAASSNIRIESGGGQTTTTTTRHCSTNFFVRGP